MRAYVAVGTNLGDRWGHLAHAARALRAEPRVAVLRGSRVFDTAPLGPPQPRYLNAVLELEAELPAQALLEALQRVERTCGRRRTGARWTARTLDLDLLLLGDQVIRTPELLVPHPGLLTRRFVLAPLAELCPDRVVPGTGQTVTRLLAAAPAGDVVPVGVYPM
ncbi:2-amino-4-hydroxy-6-hydroxymethyldihydropteridine diphosphokinase [Anaeromyxobacter terrae]|uniref:2-amino-4-hydroxy-6- hydroxymethyldihydropteridine diphosphokinase n=1 Tax=Anaeromyxobacter terrae TaxID=2925406 RepID=UPI001F5A367C|nr:2-amino-4-hydroxy-6-hydroxymethyldihydropteridine diphosphokinase [Anaeromyxobacter sp. SG22]